MSERPTLHALLCHPATPGDAIRAVSGHCARLADERLAFHYRIEGDLARMRIGLDERGGARRSGLWQHTCCEAFVARRESGYLELNFAPNGDWAAYAFASYRNAITPDPQLIPPQIHTNRGPDWVTIDAVVDLSGMLDDHLVAPIRLALTAVIEECDDRRSYWALRHGGARPDFHDGDGFLLRLDRDARQG